MLVCRMRIDGMELPPSVRAEPISLKERSSDSEAWMDYRCRKSDLLRKFNALRFPQPWECSNDSNYPTETVFKGLVDSRRCAVANVTTEELCSDQCVRTSTRSSPQAHREAVHILKGPSYQLVQPRNSGIPNHGYSRTNYGNFTMKKCHIV